MKDKLRCIVCKHEMTRTKIDWKCDRPTAHHTLELDGQDGTYFSFKFYNKSRNTYFDIWDFTDKYVAHYREEPYLFTSQLIEKYTIAIPYQKSYQFIKRIKKLGAFL